MYAIERFGSITLSPFNNSFTLSPVPVRFNILQTTGGVFDSDGSGRSRQAFPFSVNYAAVVMEDVYSDNRAVLDALRAAVGVRAKLYRRARNDSTLHWCIARLVEMPHEWPHTQRGYFTISLDFQQLTPWHGSDHASWRFDDGYDFDDGLTFDPSVYSFAMIEAQTQSQTVTNGGNLPTNDVILTVTTGANSLLYTHWKIAGKTDLIWLGPLLANSQLEIDCGAKSVKLNGVDDYKRFSFGVGHTIDDWMVLDPGENTISITASGTKTGSTWAVTFNDRWA